MSARGAGREPGTCGPLQLLWILTVLVVSRAYIFVQTPLCSSTRAASHVPKLHSVKWLSKTWWRRQGALAGSESHLGSPLRAIHQEGRGGEDQLIDMKQQVPLEHCQHETWSGATRQMKVHRSVSELDSQVSRFQTGKFSNLPPTHVKEHQQKGIQTPHQAKLIRHS